MQLKKYRVLELLSLEGRKEDHGTGMAIVALFKYN